MPAKRIGHVDLETGEVIEHATMALIIKRTGNGFGKRWIAMNQDASEEIARRRKEFGAEAAFVLLYLIGKLDYENDLVFSRTEVAQTLDMQVQNVSRALSKLTATGCLIEGKKLGNMRSYRLNPEFGWKGSGKNHRAALGMLTMEN
jgi:hypothetical protein